MVKHRIGSYSTEPVTSIKLKTAVFSLIEVYHNYVDLPGIGSAGASVNTAFVDVFSALGYNDRCLPWKGCGVCMRTAFVLVFMVLITGILSPAVSAYDMSQKFSLGAALGYYNPNSLGGSSTYLDSEFMWGIGGKYFFNENLALGIGYSVWDHSDRYPTGGYTLGSDFYGKGAFELTVKPFGATVFYFFPTREERVMPYIGLGTSNYSVEYSYTTAGVGDLATRSVSDSTWGVQAVAGVEYFTTPEFSVAGEVRYIDADLGLNMAGDGAASWGTDKESVDLSGFYFGISVNYYFGQKTGGPSY